MKPIEELIEHNRWRSQKAAILLHRAGIPAALAGFLSLLWPAVEISQTGFSWSKAAGIYLGIFGFMPLGASVMLRMEKDGLDTILSQMLIIPVVIIITAGFGFAGMMLMGGRIVLALVSVAVTNTILVLWCRGLRNGKS